MSNSLIGLPHAVFLCVFVKLIKITQSENVTLNILAGISVVSLNGNCQGLINFFCRSIFQEIYDKR